MADIVEQVDSGDNKIEFDSLMTKYNGDIKRSLFEYCFNHNLFCDCRLINSLYSQHSDAVVNALPQYYEDCLTANPAKYEGKTFFGQMTFDLFKKLTDDATSTLGFDEETLKNRMTVVETLSYDPFKDDNPEDRPQLYRDLAGMANEAMRKDVAKQKAALSIVRSYSNIEQYQRKITELTKSGNLDDDTQKQLDSYMKVISNIQASINQTAEKNNFTVKGIGSNGKGMLSDVLRQIDDKGIDNGVTNFYDIATSKSIEEVANISFKAQLSQVNLSKTDYADILSGQCKMVKEAQAKVRQSIEALRLAKEKIVKQELIDELEADYRKKGISEEEIAEFIAREYNLYDGSAS